MPAYTGTRVPIDCTFPESPDALISSESPQGSWDIKEEDFYEDGKLGASVAYSFRKEDSSDRFREQIRITYWDVNNHPDFEGIAEREHASSPLDTAIDYYSRNLIQQYATDFNSLEIREVRIGPGDPGIYNANREIFEYKTSRGSDVKGHFYVFGVANNYVTIRFDAEKEKYNSYVAKLDSTLKSIKLKDAR